MLPLSLNTLILEVVEDKNNLASDQSVKLFIKHIESVNIKAESTLLKQAIGNVIDNAIKYSPEGSFVNITLQKLDDKAVLSIQDNGCGIEKEEINKIFEPFYRIETSHSKIVPGHGLGLSIVNWIMKLHNAKIEVKSKKGKRTIFNFYFRL